MNQIIFLLSNIIDKLGLFVLIPLLTSTLTKEEYGYAANLNVIIIIVSIIFSFCIKTAASRFQIESSSKVKHDSIIFFVATAGHLFFSILVICIYLVFFPYQHDINLITLILVLAYLATLYECNLLRIQLLNKVLIYFSTSVIKCVTLISSVYFFFDFNGPKVISYAYGLILSYLIPLFFAILISNASLSVKKIEWIEIKRYLSYSLKVLPHNLSSLLNQYLDRVLIIIFLTLGELGIYSLAAQIAAILSIINNGINKAFLRKTLIAFKNKAFKKLLAISNYHILVVSLFSVITAIFSKEIILYMAGETYLDAQYVLIFFCFYQILNAVYLKACGPLYYFEDRTGELFKISSQVLILNPIISLILINVLGLEGAILGTCIAQLLVNFYIFWINDQKQINFPVYTYFILSISPIFFGFVMFSQTIILKFLCLIAFIVSLFAIFKKDIIEANGKQ